MYCGVPTNVLLRWSSNDQERAISGQEIAVPLVSSMILLVPKSVSLSLYFSSNNKFSGLRSLEQS